MKKLIPILLPLVLLMGLVCALPAYAANESANAGNGNTSAETENTSAGNGNESTQAKNGSSISGNGNANTENASSKTLTLDDFNGKTIGVQTACLYETYVMERMPDAKIEFFSDPNTMILALEQGKLDAFVTESCSFYVEKRYHPNLTLIEEPLALIDVGFVFGPASRQTTLREEINEFIKLYQSDGTIEEMEEYWVYNYDPDTCDVDRSGITGEKGVLTVALESGYEPFAFMSNGQWCGYEVDFTYRFARKYGYTPEFIGLTFDALAPAVASGKADFAAAVLSDERAEEVDFSITYIDYDLVVVYVGEETESDESFFASIASSFQKTFLKEDRWQLFGSGAFTTLIITIFSILIGTILGYLLYLFCKEGNKYVDRLVSVFGWFFHGIPAVVFLMILSYVVFAQSTLDNVIVSIIGFSLIFCFSTYDMIRSGVRAVGKGQYEAARAQGFSANQAFLLIQNPQAIFHYLPTFKSEVVSLLKETSIVGYIAVQDLTKMSDIVRSRTYEAFFPLITTAIIYFIIIAILIWLINRINPIVDNSKRDVRKSLKDIDMSKYDLLK